MLNIRDILLASTLCASLAVEAAIAADSRAAQNPCPPGWHLKAPSRGYQGGQVFTCIPDKPPQKVVCHPDTELFEEDGAFGCEPPAEIPK